MIQGPSNYVPITEGHNDNNLCDIANNCEKESLLDESAKCRYV